MKNRRPRYGEEAVQGFSAQGISGWPAEALWPLLEGQVALYTGGDSSSVPLEMAAELMESVLFCIGEGERDAGSAGTAFRSGQRSLWKKTEDTRAFYLRLKAATPSTGSRLMAGTLDAIGDFFTWYDLRFFAHDIPCMIDYPLLVPVPETEKGIHYIAEYLCRLGCENRFCAVFEIKEVRQMLERERPGYRELPLNVCEVVFARGLGGVLSGNDPAGGVLPTVVPSRLVAQLKGLESPDIEKHLQKGAARLCNRLHLWDSGLRSYLAEYAATLAPRLRGLDTAGIARLFAAGPAEEGRNQASSSSSR